eukprot:COSAG01_NODE_143_length_24153_cov_54.226116_9_plen_47_part_00
MVAEDFAAFLTRMAVPEWFTAQEFVKDLGEALPFRGALHARVWPGT